MSKHAYQTDPQYLELVALVLKVEGGYVNHPHDPGGPTKYGVAWNYHGGYCQQKFGISSVRDLTREMALQFYYDKFYLAAGCDQIPDKRFAYLHFDAAVNHGVGRAQKIFADVVSDGVNPMHFEGGGKNKHMWLEACVEQLAHRLQFYGQIRTFNKFGRGWTTNRIPELMLAILDMES